MATKKAATKTAKPTRKTSGGFCYKNGDTLGEHAERTQLQALQAAYQDICDEDDEIEIYELVSVGKFKPFTDTTFIKQ